MSCNKTFQIKLLKGKIISKSQRFMRLQFTHILIIVTNIFGQPFNIQGNIVTDELTPVRYASVTFINQNDTTQRFSTVTDTLGNYRLSVTTAVDHLDFNAPSTIELVQNFPNPFSGTTLISYQVNKPTEVSIKIYNLRGQEVRELKAATHIAGVYGLIWDGRDKYGKRVAPGVYFCQLQSGNETKVKQMLFGVDGTTINIVNDLNSVISIFTAYLKTMGHATSGTMGSNEIWFTTPITSIGNVNVIPGVTLTTLSGRTVNLNGYNITSTGGTITIESDAAINPSNSHALNKNYLIPPKHKLEDDEFEQYPYRFDIGINNTYLLSSNILKKGYSGIGISIEPHICKYISFKFELKRWILNSNSKDSIRTPFHKTSLWKRYYLLKFNIHPWNQVIFAQVGVIAPSKNAKYTGGIRDGGFNSGFGCNLFISKDLYFSLALHNNFFVDQIGPGGGEVWDRNKEICFGISYIFKGIWRIKK